MRKHEHSTIDSERRTALKTGSGLGLWGLFAMLGLVPFSARGAVDRHTFEAKSLGEALDSLGGLVSPDSSRIKLSAPEIAENGATVPITVESLLPGTQQISLLIEKNPTPLAANFQLADGLESFITARIKMAQTSTVIALVKADGKFYRATAEVKVTTGGC